MTSTTELQIETRADGVCILTLAGAKSRNSIGRPQYQALSAAIVDAGEDTAVRAIILRGEGAYFSSGGNVMALQDSRKLPKSEAVRNTDALAAMILAIRHCPTPVIAAVEGGAAGLGVSLALACDMIVAATEAQFIAAYVKIGLTPDGAAAHFLREALPRQLVSEMCMLGRPIDAERLYACGAINVLSQPGQVLDEALKLAQACANSATSAISVIKQEIESAPGNGLAAQLDLEARGINTARFGDEAGEGLQAFIEKRRPHFVGPAKG